ncbi:hypothetical protein HOD20_04050 [archaeon]|jgi:hypothetical protein|nr:hypothetical protein [Candidatus Woesearchaeota archaeon]MBT3464170.1 hypothetical protein [archaeon]MBT4351676.1 hypothetical protein [archaeon]MBT4647498.1 hypothetical protein [archaeon]MBT6822005.1 hypothetical protein [archaeon]
MNKLISQVKKFSMFLVDVTNYILLIPVYIFGVGLSKLLIVFNKKKKINSNTTWKQSNNEKEFQRMF